MDIVKIVKYPRVPAVATTCSAVLLKFIVDRHCSNGNNISTLSSHAGIKWHDANMLALRVE